MRISIVAVTILGMFAQALRAFAQSVSETEPNNTPATADTIALGGSGTGSVGNTGDPTNPADFWIVRVNAGDTIYATVDGCAGCYDANFLVDLFAADGITRVAAGIPWDGMDPQLKYVATTSGFYFVRVRYNPSSPQGHGGYTLTLFP